ncbi:hypothetical protein [Fluoribacter gormanii]|uniref:Uncharacterized protein n=1 Tax=Fluoribacter gormanii TaxID=464 RepID=A0A377GIZ1_9GAMM|nr:hypothetical protein [Fluoribacter gormanii]KTD03536.1 hypothetical protein Lgor_1521 [Fluoribacter gormanii]SIQ44046.1 hypothetical protein SAMN05421777_10140 [Fluoribacter gormanii]STO24564.1 Uncharacterised protein [Fluoribacter gormanii]
MKIPQLPFIFTYPSEISSEQDLLEQIVEFSEIGFNEKLKKRIELNKAKIQSYMKFDTSKYSESYLGFLNSMIRVLSLEEKDIDTVPIRGKRADHNYKSNQPATKNDYKFIEEIPADSTLRLNVIKRLDAFKEKLETIRNQQLLIKARSLVKLANDELVENQQNLELILNQYLELLEQSDYSQESFEELDRNFENWFGDQSISKLGQSFAEKKRIMGDIMKQCEASSVTAEEIHQEQSELIKLRENFESSKKQAEDLKSLTTQLKQIKTIEAEVAKKAEELLVPSDAPKLQELIKFITAKEEEIKLTIQKIDGTSEIHTKTLHAIGEIEQSMQKTKKQAELLEKELETRNQGLILQAQSLVKLANDELLENQQNLELIQNRYLELLEKSDYSQESFEEFDRNFENWFGDQSISKFKQSFAEKKHIMGEIMKQCEASSVTAEEISREQSKLNDLLNNFESIIEQAKYSKSLKTLFEQIKTIESAVKNEEDKLKSENAHSPQAFMHFTEDKLKKITDIKEAFDGLIPIETDQAIKKIEESIQNKKANTESDLKKIHHASSEAQQGEIKEQTKGSSRKEEQKEVQLQSSLQPIITASSHEQQNKLENHSDKGSNDGEEKKNKEALAEEKKKRLSEAISLIQTYKMTLKVEQQKCSLPFFYRSRNQAKLDYCELLEKILELQVATLTSESVLSTIINRAHMEVLKKTSEKDKEEVTKGGSFFGTSRMLSLQRLLGINEAWEEKGRSKFFGSDFHGLKTSGVFGADALKTVNDFYDGVKGGSSKFHDLKEKAFPADPGTQKKYQN